LLSQVADFLKEKNEQVYTVTLEDPMILARLNLHPENIFDFITHNPGHRLFLLIDEIQYLDNPSNFLKSLYDKHSSWLKVIATGCSAFYIDRKFRDSLAGRKQLFELYTLGFDEFLDFRSAEKFKGINITEENTLLVPRIKQNHKSDILSEPDKCDFVEELREVAR
jgi:predicted AAA+ superfamily ATPase